MKKLTAIDLCCGAGGWACAARGLPIEWVAVVDIAEDCLETWRINHYRWPDCKIIKSDLTTEEGVAAVLSATKKRRIDLVVGGIPCEQISPVRNHIPTTKGDIEGLHKLIDSVLHIVNRLAPAWWSIEDVVQIERHLPLPLFHGREVPYRRIEAAGFGPQRRLRTFLGEFPEPHPVIYGPATLEDVVRPGPYTTVSGVEDMEITASAVDKDKIRLMRLTEPSHTITSFLRGSRARRNVIINEGHGRRLLTWQEAALLQGFPEDYRFVANHGRTEKMIIQAISIYVGRAILTAICEEAKEKGTANERE